MPMASHTVISKLEMFIGSPKKLLSPDSLLKFRYYQL